jgi:dsRNA-specific ribonuclease
VSNARLCRAALDRDLDEFILDTPFTGKEWRPLYVQSFSTDADGTSAARQISKKTVADVVEAIIGAAWKTGGYDSAVSTTKAFLPEISLPSLDIGRRRLLVSEPGGCQLPEALKPLERLTGYSFAKKSLLVQATTHLSDITALASYERLEFLGNAILEVIVIEELAQYENRLPNSSLHTYREAMVNRDYLSFLALEWSTSQERWTASMDLSGNETIGAAPELRTSLAHFLRFGSDQVGYEQQSAVARHASVRQDVLTQLQSGDRYPWVPLASLHANKFFADMVESVMAAIWVDSGSMQACREMASRMGLTGHLHRLIRDEVNAMHPTKELHILAGSSDVDFKITKSDVEVDRWSCGVYIENMPVAESVGCRTAHEAKLMAADMSAALLRAESLQQWDVDGSVLPFDGLPSTSRYHQDECDTRRHDGVQDATDLLQSLQLDVEYSDQSEED